MNHGQGRRGVLLGLGEVCPGPLQLYSQQSWAPGERPQPLGLPFQASGDHTPGWVPLQSQLALAWQPGETSGWWVADPVLGPHMEDLQAHSEEFALNPRDSIVSTRVSVSGLCGIESLWKTDVSQTVRAWSRRGDNCVGREEHRGCRGSTVKLPWGWEFPVASTVMGRQH